MKSRRPILILPFLTLATPFLYPFPEARASAEGTRAVPGVASIATALDLENETGLVKLRFMEESQIREYVPVLMLGGLAVVFSFGMLVMSVVLGQKGKRSKIKDTAYECGMLPVGEGSPRLSIKFYLVAMLFILFDIEVVFLYPWAAVYKSMIKEHAAAIMGSMFSFLGVLFVGYVYALKKNAFDWKS